MKLLILNGPPDPRPGHNPLYRGTERAHPSHCDSLPHEHELNKLFFWFLREGGETGVVQNLQKAMRFCELWNDRLTDEKKFEVVEVTNQNQRPEGTGRFLGFDLSFGYNNSLLRGGLRFPAGSSQVPVRVRQELELISRSYAPQLNNNGLFERTDVALSCLRSMTELQASSPNLFGGGTLKEFEPVGVYVLPLLSAAGGSETSINFFRSKGLS